MTEIHSDNGGCHATGASQSRLRRHLLAGVATFALLAAGSAYTLRAYSADALFGGTPFGASSAARAPATPIVMPGFTDLVTAVKPAVVSVRVKADATAHRVADSDDDNSLDGSPFEKFFKDFRGPSGRRMMPGQEGRQPRQPLLAAG